MFIVLRGNVSFYRKTPKQEEIKVREREPLVGGDQVLEDATPTNRRGTVIDKLGSALSKQVGKRGSSLTNVTKESNLENDDNDSNSSSAEKERKELAKKKIMESLIKFRPFQKNKEYTLDDKLAAGELGFKILERTCDGEFQLAGEDNFLLGQMNMFSVITSSPDAVIAAADPRQLFTVLAQGGTPVIQELR